MGRGGVSEGEDTVLKVLRLLTWKALIIAMWSLLLSPARFLRTRSASSVLFCGTVRNT